MTRIDQSRVPGTAEIHRRYQDLLRTAAQNEEGRLAAVREDTAAARSHSGSRAGLNSEEMKMAQACRDFEALFIQQMLNEMRRGLREDSVPGTGGGSLAADRNRNSFFRDQMYQNISEDMADQGGFGIGSVLFEQLYRQQHPREFWGVTGPPLNESQNRQNQNADNADAEIDSVFRLLQQRQALQQKQSLTQARLESLFSQ